MDYEKNISELNEITEKLSNEKLPLEKAIELYKRAETLFVMCGDYLNAQSGSVYKIKQEIDNYIEEKLK